ncbi:MAG: potassium channel protein [candidate division Zixibacteria bacterium]|nr:potassium channel protein [candidate division Zixibacteria bacterium]NIR62574.1 potassium channel protein [candidate division Zixibacteria bacterium]NIS15337.1 potassium channel protein [candidate division Zixibacteria bacterium]NIS44691.1 potassium channel protein [candidate division Zixibacteria bacterium]NIT51862.1 potassium channel protein [candidate division Zixibacteria bacterium]
MAQKPERQLKIVLMMIIFVIIAGTIGYMLLTDKGLLDSLYMTIISITTVGYREVFEITPQLEIFTMILILSGVATIFYGITVLMQMVVEGQIATILGRRRMEKDVKKLKNHYILAGFGRVGQIVYNEFEKSGKPFVVIESDAEMINILQDKGGLYIEGNSTEDEVLHQAGIEKAVGLVSTIPSEADNVYLALSARQLNPDLKIIARADSPDAEKKLYRAGADRVICPYELGGMRMALSIIRPNVVDFMELESAGAEAEISIEEVIVPENSSLDGVTLKDSDLKNKLDIMVVAIKKPDKTIYFNPSANTNIEVGDILVLIGRKSNLAKLDLMTENNK